MTQYKVLTVELSNPQLNKLKSGINNVTEVTLYLSLNWLVTNFLTNFPHKLLSTNTNVSKLCMAFASNSSVQIRFAKTQLPKIVKFGEKVIHGIPLFGSILSNVAIEFTNMVSNKTFSG